MKSIRPFNLVPQFTGIFQTSIFYLLTAICWLFAGNIQAQVTPDFPRIKDVIAHFEQTYGLHPEDSWKYGFEKRTDGYYLTEFDWETYPAFSRREMIWSAKTKRWKTLTLDKIEDAGGRISLFENDAFYFDHLPCYGYLDWYLDVIALLEPIKKKNADVLFALAYSWDYRTQGLLARTAFGGARPKEYFNLPLRPDAMSKVQLDSFMNFKNTASGYYRQLVKTDPGFETSAGPPASKLATQQMHTFMELQLYQSDAAALEYFNGLESVPYNAFLLESARNFLASCPPNAVLISYGDNDTYPLLYVQVREHFRTDVRVLNTNLMVVGRYVNNLRKPSLGTPALKLSLNPDYYYRDSTYYLYTLREETDSLVSAFDFLQMLDSGKGPKKNGYDICTAAGLYCFADLKGALIPFPESPADADTVQIDFTGNYILKNETAILDVLLNNQEQRPLCFTLSSKSQNLVPYQRHLKIEGMVYRFDPEPNTGINENLPGYVDAEHNFTLLTERLQFDKNSAIGSDGMPVYSYYSLLTIVTVQGLLAGGDTLKAKMLLDWYGHTFSNNRILMGQWAFQLAFYYERAGYPAESKQLLLVFVDDFLNGKYKEDLEFLTQLIPHVKALAASLGDETLIEKVDKM